ncbi:MAG TPA: Asp-tRNA(Asn)/Glu-tRNA(Gln) amidotransferase subunit GatB [Anaerolineales bacterium]|nr:Asp-tRNA(Asn)/Glu-tRNA(Gln) amidotransferase subunit GatB [Anaerolineales bacterium]
MEFEPVIGLEVHAELETKSKMFCACPVVDPTLAEPNVAVCPVCSGMPGVLPVVNERAVEYALRVALALECEIAHTSIFARKNYFYPDLPKGYQISQYEQPLARNGRLTILTTKGESVVRIRRVHLEEDTGKLTHIVAGGDLAGIQAAGQQGGENYSLVDLNRAGIPLLEIVSEPDLHSAEEVRAYATSLRSILRYLGVNSGDLQKGVLRIEPNVSLRPVGTPQLGTRVEIKNLNSFRALQRGVAYEIQRQSELLRQGKKVRQETVGWDEMRGITVTQRVKEQEDDYRYFPEPDLPPLEIEPAWIERIRTSLPELPTAKFHRFRKQYSLNAYDTGVLVAEKAVADYFEQAVASLSTQDEPGVSPKMLANWISGELFGLLNQVGATIDVMRVTPRSLAELVRMVARGEINQNIAKSVLAEIFTTGKSAAEIIAARGLQQISDASFIARLVEKVLAENPQPVNEYLDGKQNIARWLFGQVMRAAKGHANPQVVQQELERQLETLNRRGANLTMGE